MRAVFSVSAYSLLLAFGFWLLTPAFCTPILDPAPIVALLAIERAGMDLHLFATGRTLGAPARESPGSIMQVLHLQSLASWTRPARRAGPKNVQWRSMVFNCVRKTARKAGGRAGARRSVTLSATL